MGLFYRREQRQLDVAYNVSIGSEQTKLIIGLGNPGSKYELTRHNAGFLCLDAFAAAEGGVWSDKKALKSLICDLRLGQSRILLCKPQTYMNNSGEAAAAVQNFFKIPNANTVVVHDELDLPFGQLRTKVGGGAAGHNGIKSLIQHIGEDFGRVRIGIGPKSAGQRPPQMDSADFVLQKFDKTEQGNLKTLTTEVNALLNEFIFGTELTTETRKFL